MSLPFGLFLTRKPLKMNLPLKELLTSTLVGKKVAFCHTSHTHTSHLLIWYEIGSNLCCRFINPLVFGDYPDSMKKNAGSRLPAFTSLESRSVKGSFDFLGLNYYYTDYIKDHSSSLKMENRDFNADVAAIPICMCFVFVQTCFTDSNQQQIHSTKQCPTNWVSIFFAKLLELRIVHSG